MEKEITNEDLAKLIGNLSVITDNNTKAIDIIAKNTAYILENMATKKDLESFKIETNIHFNNLESDLKSFKEDTNKSVKKTKDDVADLNDTVVHYDKRIEKLENKVFV